MAKSDADWADHFLNTLMACLNLSDAHQMVILVSFRSNVEPEAFADELRERPEIALAIMQVLGCTLSQRPGWRAEGYSDGEEAQIKGKNTIAERFH